MQISLLEVEMKLRHVTILRHVMTQVILAASLLGFTRSTARAQSLEACEPAPAVKAGLDQVPSYQPPDQTDWQYHERRLSAIQALLKQFPDDLFAQRVFINSMT